MPSNIVFVFFATSLIRLLVLETLVLFRFVEFPLVITGVFDTSLYTYSYSSSSARSLSLRLLSLLFSTLGHCFFELIFVKSFVCDTALCGVSRRHSQRGGTC